MNKIEEFNKVAKDICDLYEKKNDLYGDAFGKTYEKLGIISAVSRISDKLHRLESLCTNKNVSVLSSSIDDTLTDIASYAIMTLVEREGERRETDKGSICPNGIKKGDTYLCREDIFDSSMKAIYISGRTYHSERNGCLTDENKVADKIITFADKKKFIRI